MAENGVLPNKAWTNWYRSRASMGQPSMGVSEPSLSSGIMGRAESGNPRWGGSEPTGDYPIDKVISGSSKVSDNEFQSFMDDMFRNSEKPPTPTQPSNIKPGYEYDGTSYWRKYQTGVDSPVGVVTRSTSTGTYIKVEPTEALSMSVAKTGAPRMELGNVETLSKSPEVLPARSYNPAMAVGAIATTAGALQPQPSLAYSQAGSQPSNLTMPSDLPQPSIATPMPQTIVVSDNLRELATRVGLETQQIEGYQEAGQLAFDVAIEALATKSIDEAKEIVGKVISEYDTTEVPMQVGKIDAATQAAIDVIADAADIPKSDVQTAIDTSTTTQLVVGMLTKVKDMTGFDIEDLTDRLNQVRQQAQTKAQAQTKTQALTQTAVATQAFIGTDTTGDISSQYPNDWQPDNNKPPEGRQPPIKPSNDKEAKKELIAQLANKQGVISWKQGWNYRTIYPPYGKRDQINSRQPLPGIPIVSGKNSPELSLRTSIDKPFIVNRDMGVQDVTITKHKGKKPQIHFKRDRYQRTNNTNYQSLSM
jgi:hypothetical protein